MRLLSVLAVLTLCSLALFGQELEIGRLTPVLVFSGIYRDSTEALKFGADAAVVDQSWYSLWVLTSAHGNK